MPFLVRSCNCLPSSATIALCRAMVALSCASAALCRSAGLRSAALHRSAALCRASFALSCLSIALLCPSIAFAQVQDSGLKWQNYEQDGYLQTKRSVYQASELALTNRLQSLIAQENPPEKLIASYLERLVSLCMHESNNSSAEQYATLAIRFGSKINLEAEHQAMLHATLAKVYLKQNKQTQAELEYKKALSILQSHKTNNSIEQSIARCQLGLAELLTEQNRSIEADKLFKDAFEKLPQTPADLVTYAKHLLQQHKLSDASESLGKALEIDRKQLGEGQPALAAEYNDLAVVCLQQDDIEGADKNMSEAVKIARKNRYVDLPDWLQNLSIILEREGKHPESLTLQQECETLKRNAVSSAGTQSQLH